MSYDYARERDECRDDYEPEPDDYDEADARADAEDACAGHEESGGYYCHDATCGALDCRRCHP